LFGDVEIPPKAAAPVLPAAAPPVTAPPAAAPPAPAPSALTPGINALDGEAVVQALREELRAGEGGRGQARGVSAIRAQTGSGQGARGPAKADFLESFRVRTSRGLTYDFPNAPSLERWLGERDDLASCEVSLPGEDWTPAAEFLDRARSAAPRPPRAEVEVQPSQPLVGLGERAPLPRVERREHGLPPLRPRAGPAAWSLLVLSYLLLLAGLAVTVTRYGVWDLSPYLPLEQVGVLPPERLAPQPAPAEGLPERPAAVDPAKAFGQAMQAAREAMAEKRFSRAAMEFNRALAARPGAPEALEGLARAYHGLGDAERARAVAKKAQEIKHR